MLLIFICYLLSYPIPYTTSDRFTTLDSTRYPGAAENTTILGSIPSLRRKLGCSGNKNHTLESNLATMSNLNTIPYFTFYLEKKNYILHLNMYIKICTNILTICSCIQYPQIIISWILFTKENVIILYYIDNTVLQIPL